MSRVRVSEYQDPMNVTGFNTTKNISHGFRPEPTNNQHPTRVSLYDSKALELVMPNPGPLHDQYVTTNGLYYGSKYPGEIYLQPDHRQAPGSITYIKPDFHMKIARGDFSLKPNHYLSENHDAFKASRPLNCMYGAPAVFLPPRDVFVPQYQNYIYPFDKDVPYSAIRRSHPYLSTTKLDYRHFSPEELAHYQTLTQAEEKEKKNDVAIKVRVRPMLDPFEQKIHSLGQQYPMDKVNQGPDPRDYTNRKLHFKVPPYSGCAPRVFQPVEHIGQTTTFADSYSWPNSCFSKENFTHPLKVCYLQPTVSALGAYAIPHMYRSESQIYGSGRCSQAFHANGVGAL